MNARRAFGSVVLGLACLPALVLGQEITKPVPVVPPPPAIPVIDVAAPPAPELSNIWNPDCSGRDYHFYANVGMSYMWLHGGNPIASGPLLGPSFSAGIFNNRGPGVEINGTELNQSTTRTWDLPHRP